LTKTPHRPIAIARAKRVITDPSPSDTPLQRRMSWAVLRRQRDATPEELAQLDETLPPAEIIQLRRSLKLTRRVVALAAIVLLTWVGADRGWGAVTERVARSIDARTQVSYLSGVTPP